MYFKIIFFILEVNVKAFMYVLHNSCIHLENKKKFDLWSLKAEK